MGNQIPSRGAAHGKSSHADAVAINRIFRHDVLDPLQDIDLTVVLVNRTRSTPRGTKHDALPSVFLRIPGILLGHPNLPRASFGGSARRHYHYQRLLESLVPQIP